MEEKHTNQSPQEGGHTEQSHVETEHASLYSRPGSPVDLAGFEEDILKEAPEKAPKVKSSEVKKSHKDAKKKKKKRAALVVLIVLLSLVMLALVAVIGVFTYFYNRSSYHPDAREVTIDPEQVASLETIDPKALVPDDPGQPQTLDPDDPEGASVIPPTDRHKPVDDMVRPADQIPGAGSVYNILLIGVDREGQKGTNSDTMILVSVNSKKKTITLTSIMRDSAAQIPGYGFIKINSAFAVGGFNTGAQLLTDTIRYNFGFPISNYAWINFGSMKTIMDLIGGIDIYLTVKEAKYVGISIPAPQVVHLTGAQALMHARDRSSGGSDYGRTQRQRNVIMAIVQKARSGGLGNLVSLANEILPYVHHNIDAGTVASLLLNVTEYLKYDIQQLRIPIDGSFYSSNGNLIMDFQRNSSAWRSLVY